MPIVITAEEARQVPPHLCAPPMCTDDGKVTGVGAAHGRILPLVGNTRPYYYDVVVVGTDRRIYADTVTDILCVLIGEEYENLVEEFSKLNVAETVDDGSAAGYGDLLPAELAVNAPVDEDELDPERTAAYQACQNLLYELGLLRTAFAERLRVDLQAAINADAVADGSWDDLSVDEQRELTLSATRDGGFPIGIPAEVAVMDYTADPPAPTVVVRPEWRAKTILVINTGNYQPWTPAPFIESIGVGVDDDGGTYEYATNENVLVLDVETEESFLRSLAAVSYLTLETRPMHQPDALFHAMADDPVVTPYLRRNRGQTVHADSSS